MFRQATSTPCPLGILRTADANWKINKTRPFFGYSYTAPTPQMSVRWLYRGWRRMAKVSFHFLQKSSLVVYSKHMCVSIMQKKNAQCHRDLRSKIIQMVWLLCACCSVPTTEIDANHFSSILCLFY